MIFNPTGVRNFFLSFGIGGIAGVAPFLFMQLLPSLLNPSLRMDPPNYPAIVLTGTLVGLVVAIIFATQFEKREPQDIFFYALGIPAILIATVSNLSTEFRAMNKITDAKEAMTSVILNPTKSETLEGQPKTLTPPPGPDQDTHFRSTAWAQEREGDRPIFLAQARSYLVVIGEYDNQKAAWENYRQMKEKKLRTELYAPKNLSVLEIRKGSYILVYSRYSSLAEANKVYQLLRVNDPGLNVKILNY